VLATPWRLADSLKGATNVTIIRPSDEAAAIVAHYLRTLTQRAGLRWTQANDEDMARLSSLLNQVDADLDDVIPPFRPAVSNHVQDVVLPDQAPQLDTRVTQVLDSQEARQWQEFRRWQAQRAEDEQARRMMRR
jgi:hypothetical protein